MLVNKILLLPGMDGTGDLLLDFMHALPTQIRKIVPIYLNDVALSYDDLIKAVRIHCDDLEPEIIIAESFSTPLAIRIAAQKPKNLKAVILCAGFVASPVRGLLRWLSWFLAPVLMRVPLSDSVIRSLLVGPDAPPKLLLSVREAIGSVQRSVLAARLRAIPACDARSALSQISVPMLYLRARNDHLVQPRCLQEIQRIRPDMTRVVDGPHLLLQRRPTESAKLVTEFIRNLPE